MELHKIQVKYVPTELNSYTLVLLLRDNPIMSTDVKRDALKAMAKTQLPADYPIHFHFWSGDLGQYETWIEQCPRTLFSLNSGHLKRQLTQGQLQFLRSVPLDKVAFESDAPYHGSEGTSQNMGTPAGLVWTIKRFNELGSRAEDERTIAQKAKENVIRFYRPDLSIVTTPAPVPRTLGAAIFSRDSATASATTSAPVICHSTYTMFELTAVCDVECVGPHFRCASVYFVSDGHREGAILGRDWNHVLIRLTDVPILRNSKVLLAVQLILCYWGGRFLRDRPQEIMQFRLELLGHPPQEAASVLERWYSQITAGSWRDFCRLTENDIKLALLKRLQGCRVAHVWLTKVQPPFRYECDGNLDCLQPEARDVFTTINRAMPSAVSTVHGQFVARCSSFNEGAGQFSRYREDSDSARPALDEELQLAKEERYDDDDQPEHADISGSGLNQAQQRRFSQTRSRRGAPQ